MKRNEGVDVGPGSYMESDSFDYVHNTQSHNISVFLEKVKQDARAFPDNTMSSMLMSPKEEKDGLRAMLVEEVQNELKADNMNNSGLDDNGSKEEDGGAKADKPTDVNEEVTPHPENGNKEQNTVQEDAENNPAPIPNKPLAPVAEGKDELEVEAVAQGSAEQKKIAKETEKEELKVEDSSEPIVRTVKEELKKQLKTPLSEEEEEDPMEPMEVSEGKVEEAGSVPNENSNDDPVLDHDTAEGQSKSFEDDLPVVGEDENPKPNILLK